MLGYAGYINFGSIVFFGLGGYICVWLVNAHDWPLAWSLLAAGIGVSALALIFGLGILRLRGAFFALSTIGIVEGVQAFAENFTPWGGSSGIYVSPQVFRAAGRLGAGAVGDLFRDGRGDGASLYLSYAIKTSKFGLGLLAIGQNEDAAAILGVPTPLYKALVYSASAFLPAIAGGLYFFKSAFIQPSDAFDLSLSTEAIVVGMLGGQGTVTGVALGAYLYEELRGYLLTSSTFSEFPARDRRRAAAAHRAVLSVRPDGLHLQPLPAHPRRCWNDGTRPCSSSTTSASASAACRRCAI